MIDAEIVNKKDIAASIGDVLNIRMEALSSYSSIVWNRFNWFLTIVVALFGFYLSKVETFATNLPLLVAIPIIGIVMSILWFIMGNEDQVSLKKHLVRVREIENTLIEYLNKTDKTIAINPRKGGSGRHVQTRLLTAMPMLSAVAWIGISLVVYIFPI